MCGIFGYIGSIEKEQGLACLQTLDHRGPDGEGVYHTKDVFLGHKRLAILDLSDAGRQPMPYAEDRYWLVFNGEIYNFIELKEKLEKKGHSFVSQSDSEVILAAFVEWGEECVHQFNGMWALAIWDNVEKSLFISRDRFGQKPLFYAELENGFALASEMKAIAPLLSRVRPNMNIFNNLKQIFYYESTPDCIIEGVKHFPAGHSAFLVDGKLSCYRYWNTLDHIEKVPDSYEEQVQKFRELFMDACRIRMRSDVPIGTALSGGLDSSAVFCALSEISKEGVEGRVSKDWQHAFSASFPGSPIDEAYWARQVARHCGSPIKIVEVNPTKHLSDFDWHTYLFEDLYITPHIPFVATYGAMRQEGVCVTLDGHGADELFGGYGFDFLHTLYNRPFDFRRAKKIIDTYYKTQTQDGKQFSKLPAKWIFWLRHFIKNMGKRILRHRNIHPDTSHPKWKTLDYATQKLYISFHQTVLPTLLRNYDRYSMINGVEIRMPFMDYRIVTYAFSLSWDAKIRNGYTKAIIRDALRDIIPPEVVNRKIKIGFNSPMVDWFRGPLRGFFEQTLDSVSFAKSKMIASDAVRAQVESVMNSEQATFHQAEAAWMAIAPYFWERGFFDRVKNHESE